MDFSFTDEQLQLRDSLRTYLRDQYPFERRRSISISEAGWDPVLWEDLASRLGILSLGSADACDPIDVMVVMEAIGEALLIEPYLETVVTSAALLRGGGGPVAQQLLAEIVTGQARPVLAWAEAETRYDFEPRLTKAFRSEAGWRLDGLKTVVIAATWATHFVVSARTDRGTSLFVVPADTVGVTLQAYPTIDGRRAADVSFENVLLPADALLGRDGFALTSLEAVGDATIAALGAEAVGVMRRMLQDTIEFTSQRRQFGQPISQFQVLQHRMVDMFIKIEMASSAVYLATLKLQSSPEDRRRAASVAKVMVGEACRFVGQNAIQLHGGMGMTDDLAIGHYFKRCTVIENELGTVDHHISRFAKTRLNSPSQA